jgi:hypothetical protein
VVRFGGLRTVAFDGLNSLKVPDSQRNRDWIGRIRYRLGWAGYPTLRLMTLVETGTRGLLGAALGSATDRDEPTLAGRLIPLLRPGMLLLADRAFDTIAFMRAVDATGAMLLIRGKSTRRPPVLAHLSDGSYLSRLDGLNVRIIEADLSMTGGDGSRVQDRYRLITTLLDHNRYPANHLIQLYHERWADRGRLPCATAHAAQRTRPALARPPRPGAGGLGATHPLPTATHGDGHRGGIPPGHRPRPSQLHHRRRSRPRTAHRSPGSLPRRSRRPARRHRTGRSGEPAAPATTALQRPKSQIRYLPIPEPRR